MYRSEDKEEHMNQETMYLLRYLLWRREIHKERWKPQIMEWIDCDDQRAEMLLHGADLHPIEQEQIAGAVGIPTEDLQFMRLRHLDGVDTLTENLRYLIDSLNYGQKKMLAQHFQVHPNTVYRWGKGDHPAKTHLNKLCRYFGLPGTDLTTEPIFLSPSPISVVDQKAWLQERIRELDNSRLQTLFPALEILLGRR
jgi:hypothetical protein